MVALMADPKPRLAQRIRALRKHFGFTLRGLEKATGVPYSTIGTWESVNSGGINPSNEAALARGLGIEVSLLRAYLYDDVQPPLPQRSVNSDIDPSLAMYASLIGRLGPKRRQEMNEFLLKLADDELRERGGDD